MTISIELRPEEERALLERARESGRDISQYVHQVLAEHLRSGQGSEAASKTFDEILAPCPRGMATGRDERRGDHRSLRGDQGRGAQRATGGKETP